MTKKITSSITIFLLFIIIACTTFGLMALRLHWANDQSVTRAVSMVDQNALSYIDAGTKIHVSKAMQKRLVQHYLEQYFMPWNEQAILSSVMPAKTFEQRQIEKFQKDPGYGQNRHRHTQQWINSIVDNMNMARLFKTPQKAISIRDTNVRVLPTSDPSFDNWNKAGEGYPFDYIQNGRLYANVPVAILNIAKDKLWYLIETAGYIGWVRTNSIALVNNTFTQQWKKPTYVVVLQNNMPASNSNHYAILTHMNVLYPLLTTHHRHYQVLSANAINGIAHIKTVDLGKSLAAIFPIATTQKHLAELINHMIGSVYGWGGLNGYDDCSATLVDLMAPFGIYLPPFTKDQMKSLNVTSIAHLSNKQKEKFIIQQGVPFITWLYKPGHVLLYIGTKNGHAYVLQDMWGLRTRNLFGKEGRAVIGKTVITPLEFGSHYMNVPTAPLDQLEKIATLTQTPSNKPKLLWYHQTTNA
jgi:hypothetical protein